MSGVPPFGYTNAGGTLVPDANAATVKAMFTDCVDGRSPSRISRELNENSVPSPRGGTRNRQTVTNVLKNRAYTGELHNVRNAHEGIVSTRMFNKAQNIPAT